MRWVVIILLAMMSEFCMFGFLASFEPGDHQLARILWGLFGAGLVASAVWLVTCRAGKSPGNVVVGTAGALLGSFGACLGLMGLYHLGPRGRSADFWAGMPYGILAVPLGAILGAWLAARIAIKSTTSNRQLTFARASVLFMTIVPLLLLLAGLAATPGRPNDPIAVSTVFALFVVTPGAIIVALLLRRFLPQNRPLLRSCSIAAVFSLAALVWIGDFWLIGIGAGLKWSWLKMCSWPTAAFILLTAYQWPRSAAENKLQTSTTEPM